MSDPYALQETLTDLREDVTLLRLCLQGLLKTTEDSNVVELRCLWRLSDYLDQHVKEVEQLL